MSVNITSCHHLVPVVEEDVSQTKLDEDDDPVACLHHDEAPEVDVVLVVHILCEKVHQDVLLFLLVLHEPGRGPLPEELHEAALHDQPAHAGEVEHEGEEDQVEWHPLHIGIFNIFVH